MGRYIKDVEINQPIDVVSMLMEDYVYHNRFSRTDWNGEMVFYLKDKHGRERYMKWSYAGGVFHVEAWLKNIFGNEMDLDGAGGGASRREFRMSMDALVAAMKNQTAASISSGHVGSDPLHHSKDYKAEHKRGAAQKAPSYAGSRPSAGEGTGNQSALVIGVVALLFGSIPVIGLVLGIVGLKKALQSGGRQKAAKLVCVLAIIESVIMLGSTFLLPLFMHLLYQVS